MKDKRHIQSFNENQENLNISDVIHSDISDFKPWVVAGFTLCGYKVENGYVLGDKNGDFIKDFPQEIRCNNVTYTLENIEVFGNDFVNAHYL